jgi:hypothetical protein
MLDVDGLVQTHLQPGAAGKGQAGSGAGAGAGALRGIIGRRRGLAPPQPAEFARRERAGLVAASGKRHENAEARIVKAAIARQRLGEAFMGAPLRQRYREPPAMHFW